MATASSFTKYRSWSTVESEDPSDVGRLYTPPEEPCQKKLKKTYSTWAFSLIILSLSVVFLVGLLVGYYLKDSQKDECRFGERTDKFDTNKLQSVHENIMYFISNDNVRKISRDLQSLKDKQTEYVKKEFTSYGLDRVEIQEHEVVVTYPDPSRSNLLVVIGSSGQVLTNLTLGESKSTNRIENLIKSSNGVKQLQPSIVEGELVYGDYGRRSDLIKKTESLKGKILMVRDGGNISLNEKISIASSFGVGGVLFHEVDTDDTVSNSNQYKSVDDSNWLPVEIITENTAEILLTYYSLYNRSVTVRLTSNYVEMKQTVRNVVGIITGDLERDIFVMIGATRSPWMPQVGTGYMLELARSFKDMQAVNGWIPRRSVQFYSWDHDGVTDLGFNQFIKLKNTQTASSVIGYIDLDLVQQDNKSYNSSHWLHITGSPVFSDVLENVIREIPDPDHAELVLHDTWKGEIKDVTTQQSGLHVLGIPAFKASMSSTKNLSQKTDEEHHHVYSLAVSRVASLVTLRLLDDEVLPFNLTYLTRIIYNTMIKKLKDVQRSQNFLNTELLLAKLEEFRNAGRTFSEYVKELVHSSDPLAKRRINDAMTKFERILSLPVEKREHDDSLQKIYSNRHISSVTDLLSVATVTNDNSYIEYQINNIINLLQEAIFCLQSI